MIQELLKAAALSKCTSHQHLTSGKKTQNKIYPDKIYPE